MIWFYRALTTGVGSVMIFDVLIRFRVVTDPEWIAAADALVKGVYPLGAVFLLYVGLMATFKPPEPPPSPGEEVPLLGDPIEREGPATFKPSGQLKRESGR
jgi:hypothetical protein